MLTLLAAQAFSDLKCLTIDTCVYIVHVTHFILYIAQIKLHVQVLDTRPQYTSQDTLHLHLHV